MSNMFKKRKLHKPYSQSLFLENGIESKELDNEDYHVNTYSTNTRTNIGFICVDSCEKLVPELELDDRRLGSNDLSNMLQNPRTKINNTESLREQNQIERKANQVPKKGKGVLIKDIKRPDELNEKTKEDNNRESSIKKIFLSENVLKSAKNPEELQKILGIKKEEILKSKEERKRQFNEVQKELYSLPDYLQGNVETCEDHVENLMKLSAAGLIEVPLPLEQKLKNIEETDKLKKHIIDNKLQEELDYLKVLKKIGPSYCRGYKNDLSQKKMNELNRVFKDVFVNYNGRKRKLQREKTILENRRIEEQD